MEISDEKFSGSSISERSLSLSETKRPAQYAELCAVYTFRGSVILVVLFVVKVVEDDVEVRARVSATIGFDGLLASVVVVDMEGFLDAVRVKLASDDRENELVMFEKTPKVRDLGIPGGLSSVLSFWAGLVRVILGTNFAAAASRLMGGALVSLACEVEDGMFSLLAWGSAVAAVYVVAMEALDDRLLIGGCRRLSG